MKDSFIVKGVMAILLLSAVVLAGCSASTEKRTAHEHTTKQEYTCPMHPQIVREKPGKCPICGMDLVPKQTAGQQIDVDSSIANLTRPVNEQVVATTATIQPESSMRILSVPVQGSITYDTRNQTTISSRVSGRIERLLVKYNYQPVKKGQLIMEIYSPDLAAAQRELLFIYQQDRNNTLLQKAKLRLSLLGMQEGQINQVLRTGKVSYRVPVYSNASGYILEKAASVSNSTSRAVTTPTTSGGSDMNSMNGGGSSGNAMNTPAVTGTEMASGTSPVLIREGQYVGAGQTIFTIYGNNSLVAEFSFDPKMSSLIKRGQRMVFYKTSDPEAVHIGTIGLIQPTFKAGSRFTVARVYLNDTRFQVGQLVTANVPITNKGWWVPQSAVLFLGNQSVVFKKEGAVFVPKPVQTRVTAESMVLIESGLSGNWEIAKNAAYMVDSESFIKLKSDAQKQSQ